LCQESIFDPSPSYLIIGSVGSDRRRSFLSGLVLFGIWNVNFFLKPVSRALPLIGSDSMSDYVSPKKAEKMIAKAMKKAITPASSAGKLSKYDRYSMDWETLHEARNALPSVYKFFLMIYRLSPVRTGIIIAVFLIQGLLPALRLRTGGDFIRQVSRENSFAYFSFKRGCSLGR
jgi:hypothetical protein